MKVTSTVRIGGVSWKQLPRPNQSQPSKQRFYGSVELDSERINRDASQIADEILQHLISLVGAKVKVTLEIEAEVENGIPEK